MFSHIMGFNHRRKVIEKHRNASIDWTQQQCLVWATNHAENSSMLSNSINTVRDDALYPWPSGKAPWSIEKGGTGLPPEDSKENFGRNTMERKHVPPPSQGELFSERKPTTTEEMQKFVNDIKTKYEWAFDGKKELESVLRRFRMVCDETILEILNDERKNTVDTKEGIRYENATEISSNGLKRKRRNSRSPSPSPPPSFFDRAEKSKQQQQVIP